MLVKDLISTFRPREGDGTITYIFSSKEDTLCTSENYDFVSETFGDREVISWKVESHRNPWLQPKVDLNCDDTATVTKSLIFGVIDNGLYITCEQPHHYLKNDHRLLSPEEYEEKIRAWKGWRKKEKKESDEEFEERNQKFLESLNEMPDPSKYDAYDIRNLPVDKGVINPLIKAGVKTLGDLKTMSAEELSLIPRISNKRIEDIKDALYRYGLYLKQD